MNVVSYAQIALETLIFQANYDCALFLWKPELLTAAAVMQWLY